MPGCADVPYDSRSVALLLEGGCGVRTLAVCGAAPASVPRVAQSPADAPASLQTRLCSNWRGILHQLPVVLPTAETRLGEREFPLIHRPAPADHQRDRVIIKRPPLLLTRAFCFGFWFVLSGFFFSSFC